MLEKRWNRSVELDCCWVADVDELTVVSCVIFVVARTLNNRLAFCRTG